MASRYCARCLSTFLDDAPSCPNLGCGGKRPPSGWGFVLGPGDEIDRHYRIVRPLAVGGAGLTYLARAIDASGEAVAPDLAVKVLYAQRASGPYLRRLATEFQILQDLDHEHIVKCRGFVQRAGQEPYLVTLFEQGGSLGSFVEEKGGLDVAVAVGILRQILAALDVAHQRGVVHRDLKPDNVLLCARPAEGAVPVVRVSDFGIAKVAGGDFSKLTRTGTFVGTPEYAAPEQFLGEAATPATDVFAAGALLWYLVHGRAPVTFTERTDVEGCYEAWLAALPPRFDAAVARGSPSVVAALPRIFEGMLAVSPEDRWTIQQVLKALRAALDSPAPAEVGTLELTAEGAQRRAEAHTARRTPRPSPVLVPPRTQSTMETAPVVAAGGAGCALAGAVVAGAAALVSGVALFVSIVAAGDPPRVLLGAAAPADRALRRSIQAQTDAVAVGLAACRGAGAALATVHVAVDGRTTVAGVDGDAGDCVRRAVDGLQLAPIPDGPVEARLGWLLEP
jgi:serine/threonine-protein kinase